MPCGEQGGAACTYCCQLQCWSEACSLLASLWTRMQGKQQQASSAESVAAHRTILRESGVFKVFQACRKLQPDAATSASLSLASSIWRARQLWLCMLALLMMRHGADLPKALGDIWWQLRHHSV